MLVPTMRGLLLHKLPFVRHAIELSFVIQHMPDR